MESAQDGLGRGRGVELRAGAGARAAATASRSAKKADRASISGGSPTALARWMLSSALALSNRRTLKTGGRSEMAGIL